MNAKKHFFRLILVILGLNLTAPLVKCQNSSKDVITLDVDSVGVSTMSWLGLFDKVIIVSAPGITWLRISTNPPSRLAWETSTNVLYDGVPITGSIMICPKILDPNSFNPPFMLLVRNVFVAAWGKGSVTLRRIQLAPDPPYVAEGEYLDKGEPVIDGYRQVDGMITMRPQYFQPGNTTNIQVTIPWRIRRHITGVVLKIPVPPNPNIFIDTLPFDADGVYDYAWTVPIEPYGDNVNLGGGEDVRIQWEAYSNKPNENGQPYLVTSGIGHFNITKVLKIQMFLQGEKVTSGSTAVAWENNKPRNVSASWYAKGRGPYKVRWIVNGKEIPTLFNQLPNSQMSKLEDQNALVNNATITCEVTDANGNKAQGVIFVGVENNMSFQINVQGVKVEDGKSVNWRKGESKRVTINPIRGGQPPLKARWLINNVEAVSKTLVNRSYDDLEDQKILDKAENITFELTDANSSQISKTIYIGNPSKEQDTVKAPIGPVGPAPVPPPLTGDPNKEPNPDIEWNNKPWLDAKVQVCTREYLQKIVLYMENEIRKWENTGLPESKQNALFTSIDDWGRLLNQYITATGGVDGNWDNPTHFVWSAYNKPSSAVRYGRTVEYYVKYECGSSQPSPDDINNAINNLSNDNENTKWDSQRIKNAQANLNSLLDNARRLYNLFNTNYNKFVNEINDQKSNPVENELIALCLASAQNQLNDHSINKDTLDVAGNELIAQSALNSDIDMFEIIRILSEVQIQNDDMTKKIDEMKNLLAARGGDIDEITSTGQRLIAQGNVDPEFAQDGGVNVEFYADGVDNFGDGLQDFMYGNVRRGNVLFVLWDSGNVADDILELIISGKGSQGQTPPGGRRNFDVTLNPGTYTITIKGVYTNPNSTPCTFGIQVYDRDLLILEQIDGIEQGITKTYVITIR